jgi:hypothetical protein
VTPSRSTDTLSAEAFAAWFTASVDEPVYVLLGVQGAGTNLLSRLLTRACNLSVLHDQALVVRVVGQLGLSPSATEIERAFHRIRTAMFPGPLRRRLIRPSIHPDSRLVDVDAYFRAAAPRTPADLARFVYAYRAFRTGHTGLAIKSDDIWEHMGNLDRVLPNRRVVLLTRDFRDNVMSVIDKPFGPRAPSVAAEYVRSRFAHYECEYRQHPNSSRHVRFEDLVSAPITALAPLGRWLGHFEQDGAEERLRDFRIRPGRVGRWRALAPRQLAICEAILRRELLAYGYGLVTATTVGTGRWERVSAIAADALLRIPQKLAHLNRRLSG